MKVVFLENVEGTAQVGEIKVVKNGFARNYLLPRGLAAPAIEPYLTRATGRAKHEVKLQDELDTAAAAVAARIEGSRISIPARVGEQGKLYGSVTSVHIADEVAKLIGEEELDHKKVLLPESIRVVGVQTVRVRLTRNVEASIEVEVFSEGGEAEETSEEAAPEAEGAVEGADGAPAEEDTSDEEEA